MPWWHHKHADNGQGGLTTSAARQQPRTRKECSAEAAKLPSIASMARALLVTRRRLRLFPNKRLYFLYEPGKQVSSVVKIKNTSRSPVAFKFQTNAPKSCFMRPPSCILAPGETILATVVKFVEIPEQNQQKKNSEKFRIVSLKVKKGAEYTPEMFDENKEIVAVEQVLRAIFLDPQCQSPEIEKLKKRLAEADAALQARKKPPEEKVQKTLAAGGVLDEWKEQQREKRLARQQIEGVDSPEVVV